MRFTLFRSSDDASARSHATRWLFHLSLTAMFATVSGVALVWPQWLAADGSRTALDLQSGREEELTDRLNVVRALKGRLTEWGANQRRVFLPAETRQYPTLVMAVAKREGATVLKAEITNRPAPRWRSATVPAADAASGSTAGEIQPVRARVVLKGSFDSVYRTVGNLCQQQQLFVPDQWDLAPTAGPTGLVKAEVWGTVLIVREADTAPAVPTTPAASGPVALGETLGGKG